MKVSLNGKIWVTSKKMN